MKKVLLFLICAAVLAFGQANDAAVREASRALRTRDYAGVVRIFQTFSDTARENNPSLEFLKPIYIEALSFQQKYDEITSLSASYIAQFPNSQQIGRVYYLWGVALANQSNFVQAIVALDEGLKVVGRDRSTDNSIRSLISLISERHLSPTDRQKALANGLSAATAGILGGAGTAAASTTATTQRRGGGSAIARTIGLLIPMTGEFSDLGQTALNVVNMILAQHEAKTGEKIAVKVYDTEGNAVRAAVRTRELLNDGISMVIGPIMSNTATTAAAILSEHPNRAVMITPTATDDGIAALGENIFQLNMTQRALAEKIANYAVEDLGIKRFTILAPLNDYGRIMTGYFSAAVREKGGVVEFTEYFSTEASDHRRQFNALREHYANMRFGESPSNRERTQFLADTTIVLGGLFIPVSQPENAIQLAAQVPFHKLRAQILGTNIWDNQRVIDEGRTTVQNVCFSTAQRIDREGEAFTRFIQNYRTRFEAEPNLIVAPLVADAVSLMLRALSQSNTPADLSKNLSQVRNFQGLSSEISFDNTGVNSGAVVMKISGQRAIRVK